MSDVISTQSITRRFGEIVAVDQVSLKVAEGQIFGFLGPNGSGKSTTIRMLLGLIRPDRGDIQIFGKSMANSRNRILADIGALVEQPSLYGHLSGRDNVEVTRRLIGAPVSHVEHVLSVAGISSAASQLVRTYSLGMKQRLGLAIALLNHPKLLILDEPTNGLDPAGIHEMRHLIRRLPTETGVTIFLSSHLLHEVEQMADTVGIINKGKLLFQGAIANLNHQKELTLFIKVDKPVEAFQLLRSCAHTKVKIATDAVEMEIVRASDSAGINKLLVENGISVFEMRIGQATLEHLFLELTGQSEREEAK